jgi:hypothetical protein
VGEHEKEQVELISIKMLRAFSLIKTTRGFLGGLKFMNLTSFCKPLLQRELSY